MIPLENNHLLNAAFQSSSDFKGITILKYPEGTKVTTLKLKNHISFHGAGILLQCETLLLKNYKVEKLSSLEKLKENKNNL